jgi:hypothetical protein
MSDKLMLNIRREVEPEEIDDMVFGAGGTMYPWWLDVERIHPEDGTWLSGIKVRSWDGEGEGEHFKISKLTNEQILLAVEKAWIHLDDVAQRDMTEHLGQADAIAADIVLQVAVFGEIVYG